MTIEQPAQSFERFAVLGGSLSPLFLADLIDSAVERFDDMEAIQHERGVRAMILNGADVGLTHIAAGQSNLGLLVIAEHLIEEPVNGITPLAGADPHHAGSVQVVNQRRVFVALGIGNLIDADSPEPPDLVPVTGGRNAAMQQVGERRGRGMQQRPRTLLRHHLTIA